MHPSHHAVIAADRPAVIISATGQVQTYGDLDRASNRGAHLLRSLGLSTGDVFAVMLDNHPDYFELVWAAQRAGLYLVTISSRLTAGEVDYILTDSDARVLVTSTTLAGAAGMADWSRSDIALFVLGPAAGDYRSWEAEAGRQADTPIIDERAGGDMLYSSGTTGRPKGIKAPLPLDPAIAQSNSLCDTASGSLGFGPETVYLCPAPLYHAAPLRWSMATHRLGGTVVVMEKFDAAAALAAIERYGVTHGQWVPTHFIRMLKLTDEERLSYDLSTMRVAIHAAAPCPVPVKCSMIDWWGPILIEYYAGTEGNGMTLINSAEWLEHPGSVGRAVTGILHIVDESGEEVPARTKGMVYFEGGSEFVYHNDPDKTRESRNAKGWSTLGDIGWTDEDGYLYLTDRKSFMIISGGVNIYPQEIENLLVTHPKVADVAVIGAPDAEMGERVVAVVQPADIAEAGPELAAELSAWLRPQLSGVKMPRQVDFRPELPRHATGKLYKRLLRDEYWEAARAS